MAPSVCVYGAIYSVLACIAYVNFLLKLVTLFAVGVCIVCYIM